MPYAQKIILHAPPWDSPLLDEFVKACLRDNVLLIAVVGQDCERVHDVIDAIIVGDGSSDRGFGILTSWHAHETLPEVWKFVRDLKLDGDVSCAIQEVVLVRNS